MAIPTIGMQAGEPIAVKPGVEIRGRVAWVAYARNGNNHNPTITKEWDIWVRGQLFETGFTLLRKAKAAAREIA